MITQRLTRPAMSGFRSSADAMLLSGPSVTKTSGIAVIAQPVLAVKPIRALVLAAQRLLRSDKYRNMRVAKFGGVQRISRRLLDADISRDGRNRQHANLRRAQRHDQRHGVVRGGVRIDQEGSHAALG